MFIHIGHKGVITDHVEKNQNNLENSPIFWEEGKKCERKKDWITEKVRFFSSQTLFSNFFLVQMEAVVLQQW